MKPNLLIIANRTLHSAPRVIREINVLKSHYNITTIGLTPPNEQDLVHIDYSIFDLHVIDKIVYRWFRMLDKKTYMEKRWPLQMIKLTKVIKETKPDYIIIHEPHFLPYLAKIKESINIKIIFNAHEYHPLEFEENPEWLKFWKPYYESVYRKYLKIVDLMVNVCDSIAEKCYEEFGKESIVIPNAAFFADLPVVDNRDKDIITMIYHGNCSKSRKIEEMIKVMELLGNKYKLDLMFVEGANEYSLFIKQLVSQSDNVNIIPPVDFNNIISAINNYDIGIYILAPSNYNNRIALPNKFFEYIQARLCIAIAPSFEMKKITDEYDIGVVSEDFTAETLAKKIASQTKENIYEYKMNSEKAASLLSAEHYREVFINAIQKL